MKALILAGGLGTRLRETVPDTPKCMALVAGRPFLEILMLRLIGGGIREICLAVGFKAEAIIGHFGDSWSGARITYSRESTPLGTGGAIVAAMEASESATSLVVNGDTLLDLDIPAFQRWYEAKPTTVAMALSEVDDTARFGAVELEGETVVGFAEKGRSGPGVINAGVYMIRREAFSGIHLPEKFSFENDFLAVHLRALKPRAYVTQGLFIDIGTPADYARAQSLLRQAH